MIRKKNYLYHKFLRTREPATLDEFKKLRNRLNAELRRAKISYYHELFTYIPQKHPAAAWKVISSVLGCDRKGYSPEKITCNDRQITGKALAEHFNEYLVNIVPRDPDIVGRETSP